VKRFIIVLILGTFVPLLGTTAELPATVGAGLLVSETSHPLPVFATGAVQNLKEFAGSSGVTKIQLYVRGTALYIDDYYADQVTPEVLALDPVLMTKLFAGPITVGLGVGGQWEVVSGADNFLPVFGGELGWNCIPEYLTINVGAWYLPVGEHKADLMLGTVGLGLDAPKLVSAFTGWLAK
jgi:hypothetical protein